MPPLPRLPVIDPEVLALYMLVGGVLGALAAGASLVANTWALQTGSSQAVLPVLPGLLEQSALQEPVIA